VLCLPRHIESKALKSEM